VAPQQRRSTLPRRPTGPAGPTPPGEGTQAASEPATASGPAHRDTRPVEGAGTEGGLGRLPHGVEVDAEDPQGVCVGSIGPGRRIESRLRAWTAADDAHHIAFDGRGVDAGVPQDGCGDPVAARQQAQQEVFSADVVVSEASSLALGVGDGLAGA
jgi:hypothetical protein